MSWALPGAWCGARPFFEATPCLSILPSWAAVAVSPPPPPATERKDYYVKNPAKTLKGYKQTKEGNQRRVMGGTIIGWDEKCNKNFQFSGSEPAEFMLLGRDPFPPNIKL